MEAVTRSHIQYPAHEITNEQRKQLALRIIRNENPVSHIAEEKNVSRKFLYKQKAKAISAIDQAFEQKGQDAIITKSK